MYALVKKKAQPGAVYTDVADPKLQNAQALVRVHRASICGSDMAIYDWQSWARERVKPPLIFGHEICGEVVETLGCKKIRVGDKVAVESHIFCNQCGSCKQGDFHVCENLKIVGIDIAGGFAQAVSLSEGVLWKIEDPKFYDYANLMEPLGNAIYATCAEEVHGKSVLVLGCGPQGLFAIQVAKAKGARYIAAVEKSEFRKTLARKFGADAVFGENASLEEVLDKFSGYDVVLEMSGSKKLMALAMRAVRNGGRVSFFGIPSGVVAMDIANDLIFKGVRIYGIVGRKIFDTWRETQNLIAAGSVRLDEMVTHNFPLSDFKAAFDMMHSKEGSFGKIVFDFKPSLLSQGSQKNFKAQQARAQAKVI